MIDNRVKNYFKNKRILITGGTGSFGEYLVRTLINLSPKKIIIFSRDELKQFNLRNELKDHLDILDFKIGDVRDFDSLLDATRNIDIIYHAAAMKHVPICEENPMEAVYTNTYGALNLREAALVNKVAKVIAISTDKAVRSVNVMGMTKAIAERIILSKNLKGETEFTCVRFGNVVGSRGSVVPFFKQRIKDKKSILLTDRRMTRFLIDLEEAMSLIFTATLDSNGGEIFVKKMPVCEIYKLAEVMIENIAKVDPSKYKIEEVGLRQGEQLYETLVSEEEMGRTIETKDYFIIYKERKSAIPGIKIDMKEYRTDLFKKMMTKDEIKIMLQRSGWL